MENWREVKKVELHRHLEGAVRLQTVFESAKECGINFPVKNLLEFRKYASVVEPMADLATVLNKMYVAQSVMATPKIIERIAYEACIDAFADGIRVLELRYSLGFISLNHPNLKYDQIHRAITDGIFRAEKELHGKLAVGLIATISRDQKMEEALKTTEFVLGNKDSFIGMDLAGDEAGYHCSLFISHFEKLKDSGLGITIHSGEIPQGGRLVKESIEILGATRIGHGITIIETPEVMEFVKSKNVVLEVCPTSNVYTKVVNSIKEHPLPKLMKNGVRVTLNSDDPQFFGISLSHEYEIVARELNFSLSDFEKLNEEALRATFINPEKALKAWNN